MRDEFAQYLNDMGFPYAQDPAARATLLLAFETKKSREALDATLGRMRSELSERERRVP